MNNSGLLNFQGSTHHFGVGSFSILNNKAYWQGHPNGAVSVNDENQTNTIGGTASLSPQPSIKVVKRDQTNLAKALSGAKFTLQEVTWDEEKNKWVNAAGSSEQVGTTNDNGEIIFGGQSENNPVGFNRVYRLTETSAPNGYFLDNTPRYIVIARSETVNGAKNYPSELTTYESQGAIVEYNND